MKTDIIIHIGYGKTATTWLQNHVFSDLPSNIFLGKKESDYPRWLLEINYLDDIAYELNKSIIKDKILSLIEGQPKVLISSEAFTNLGQIYNQATRIKYLFQNPRIILVLRHPIDWLISNYKYCVEYEGFFLPIEEYLDFGEKRTPFALEKRAPFYIPDLFYDETTNLYESLFGKENVLILKFEDFKNNTDKFGQTLSDFLGIELQGFKRKSELKIIVSKKDNEIWDNLKKNLCNVFMKFNLDENLMHSIFKNINFGQPIILDKTKEKLSDIFKQNCTIYYSDL